MATRSGKLTYAYLRALPADRQRHEIIDGEEFMTPSPDSRHQTIVVNFVTLLKQHVAAAWDRGAKGELYSRAGVREYWLVDPAERTVEIRELGSPRRAAIYKEGQSFQSRLLPGLVVELAAVFAE